MWIYDLILPQQLLTSAVWSVNRCPNSAKRWSIYPTAFHPCDHRNPVFVHMLPLSPHTHCKAGTTVQSPMISTIRDSWRMTHNAVQPCLQRGRLPIFPLFFFAPQPPHSSVPAPSQPPNLLTIHKLDLCIHIPRKRTLTHDKSKV